MIDSKKLEEVNLQATLFSAADDELRKRRDKENTEIWEKALVLFRDVLGIHKSFISISWQQYAPYFNDGEACIFGIRDDLLSISYTHEGEEDTHVFDDYSENPLLTKAESSALFKSLRLILNSIPVDALQERCDDGKVTVTATEVTFKQVSHD